MQAQLRGEKGCRRQKESGSEASVENIFSQTKQIDSIIDILYARSDPGYHYSTVISVVMCEDGLLSLVFVPEVEFLHSQTHLE